MKIYLVRHGQSLGNVDPRAYYNFHDYEIPLTQTGECQAVSVGDKIASLVENRPFRIIRSPFRRATNTASIIDSRCILQGKWGTVYEDPLIYERSWGNLREIVESPDLDRQMHFNFFYRPVGGESFADTYVRVALFFSQLKQDPCQDETVIVTHGEWIRLALMYLRGYSVKYFTENRKNPENGCCIIENL